MSLPTHLVAGLIIGKLLGNYPLALFGALAIDLDHIAPYLKHNVLFNPKKLLKTITDQNDPYGNQRNFLHSLFVYVIISTLLIIVDFRLGLILSLAYLTHLVIDALDAADFYPFYPNRKINFRGPIGYFSKQEFLFTFFLFLIFLIL